MLWNIFSIITFYTYEEKVNPIEVVAVQPNIDPYNEKFGSLTSEEQVQRMFELAEQKTTEKNVTSAAPRLVVRTTDFWQPAVERKA